MNHHSKCVFNVEFSVGLGIRELEQCGPRLVEPAMTDQPPGRFRSQEGDESNREWPDPLDGIRYSVSPLGGVADETFEDASSE